MNTREAYEAYLHTEGWKVKSEAAKEAAGQKCQFCNRSAKQGAILQAHHRSYARVGDEIPGDIAVMCSFCHGKLHEVAQLFDS